jgi:cation:H+ antiporter
VSGTLIAIIEIAIGFYLLTRAADEFVEGAANVAHGMRVSPVVIGAVVVGFGTSAPELLVSGIAAFRGDLDLGVGNVVGSNVANLTLVLGAAALIIPIFVSREVLRREGPLSLAAVGLFGFFTIGGLSRAEGVILLVALAVALGSIIASGKVADEDAVAITEGTTVGRQFFRTVIGLIGTVAGAQLLVWGAITIAEDAGLSGGFVGFTLIAIGTSLPELVTAVAAARKGETELILGNLLGSNIFNSLAVGSAIALIGPGMIADDALRTIGVTVMIAVAGIAYIFMVTRKRIHKFEAWLLLAIWVATIGLMFANS